MTNTMLGELSRLFRAEARKAPSPASAHRLRAIAQELSYRNPGPAQFTGANPLPTIIDPLNLGGKIQDLATPTDPTSGIQGALSSIADQIKTQTATASGSAEQAGNQAQQAGQQAQTAATSVNTVLLAVAVGIGLVIILTRK